MDDVELKYAITLFERLRETGRDPDGAPGVTRQTYGLGENLAHGLIFLDAREFGIDGYVDDARNLWLGSPTNRSIVIGSHLDSVPCGGNFDGAAGVVAGLLVMRRLQMAGMKLPLQVVALRGEESAWFGECYLGSKALLEGWTDDTFSRVSRATGMTLREIFGADTAPGPDGARLGRDILSSNGTPYSDAALARRASCRKALSKPLRSPDSIRAYLELHIEQGPVLVDADIPLGVVTGIRGNVRHTITCHGEAGHSGTTPMHARHDAVEATVQLLYRWRDWSMNGTLLGYDDLVTTTGILHTDQATESVSAIAAKTMFSLEWRSLNKGTLTAMGRDLRRMTDEVTSCLGCTFEISAPIRSEPANMDKSIQRFLHEACEHVDVPRMAMPSGAGHDAAMFAMAGIPTGMLFIRNQNGSHNPNEAMDMTDFMKGVDVLHRTVCQIAKSR